MRTLESLSSSRAPSRTLLFVISFVARALLSARILEELDGRSAHPSVGKQLRNYGHLVQNMLLLLLLRMV